MKGVFERFKMPVGKRKEKGIASISAFEFSRAKDPMAWVRSVRDGMTLYDGNFVRLVVDGELMMTDTNMERVSNMEFVHRANGHVLIAGLGIGLIIYNIEDKLKKGIVKSITVVEKYADVAALVSNKFPGARVIVEDINDFKVDGDDKYDTIYFDIWPTISTDNLQEIYELERKFRKHLNKDNPNRWIGSWMKKNLQRIQRKEKRSIYY